MALIQATPTQTDLFMVRGTDINILVTSENTSGVAQDITNDSVTFTARKGIAGTVLLEQTNASGQHTAPASGTTTFTIADTETETSDFSAYESTILHYEVRRIFQAGEEVVYLSGLLRVTATPTPS